MSIRDLLDKKFFPHVIKPGRYAGGELGQVVKDHKGRTAYLHVYPDKYEIGQSYVGLQVIYNIVNQVDRFVCERAFAIDTDAEEIMRRENIPLFSLETSRPATDFDAIGFTLVDETVYTNMLTMIDLAGIPLRSQDRDDSHPIIMAGGPSVFNPEPLSPFVDVFFLGDGEDGLLEILSILNEMKDRSREQKLTEICKRVPSVYIPRFYDDERKPLTDFAPATITPRVIPQLKAEFYPDQPIVPQIETVQSHLGIEIMRGCPQSCRFCMARQVYRPVRARDKNEILKQIETQVKNTGYDEVCLLSLSSSDYPHIDNLAAPLARSLEKRRVSITLPSLRPGSVSPKLLDSVKRVRRYGLTLAPEAGTERLRLFLGKNISDQAIFDTVRLAIEKGWSTLKLYFMVGLPSETEEDLKGIIDLCHRVHQISREHPGKRTINVTLSPFVPKPHTPFQWDEAVPEAEIYKRINFVKNKIKLGGVNVKHNSTQLAQVVAVVGRGSHKMADSLEAAWRKGCRFDGWSEMFDYDVWNEAFEEAGVNVESSMQAIPFSTSLPWSHIDKGVTAEHLQEERNRTSTKLRQYVPVSRSYEEETNSEPKMSFGRSKKKVASRSTIAPTKSKVRIKWGKTARHRYLSHLDNIRLIEMALRRANVPVSYSQGFNPAPKLSFGPPLPLGFTSVTECVDITLETNLTPSMIEDLRLAMPEGIEIYAARAIHGKSPSLSSTLNRVVYRLPLEVWSDTEVLARNIESVLSRESLEYVRTRKEVSKNVDIRSAIYELNIEGDHLDMILGLGDGGYAKPPEVADFLSEGLIMEIVALPFERREMYRIDEHGLKIDAMDL